MEKLFLLREIILSRIYVVKNTNLFIYIYVVKKYQSVYIHMAPLPNTFFFCQFLLLSSFFIRDSSKYIACIDV